MIQYTCTGCGLLTVGIPFGTLREALCLACWFRKADYEDWMVTRMDDHFLYLGQPTRFRWPVPGEQEPELDLDETLEPGPEDWAAWVLDNWTGGMLLTPPRKASLLRLVSRAIRHALRQQEKRV